MQAGFSRLPFQSKYAASITGPYAGYFLIAMCIRRNGDCATGDGHFRERIS